MGQEIGEVEFQDTGSEIGKLQEYHQLDLTPDEQKKVAEIAASIDLSTPISISQFGGDIFEHSSAINDKLLERIRSKSDDTISVQLNQMAKMARESTESLMLDTQRTTRQRIYHAVESAPFIGGLTKRLRRGVQSEMDKYASVAQQMESFVENLGKTQEALIQDSAVLDENFKDVVQHIRLIEIHIQASKLALQQKQDELNSMPHTLDPIKLQERSDAEASMRNMRLKIDEFIAVQLFNYHNLPAIRMIQAGNQQNVERINTRRQLALPAWKQGFVIRGALTRQKNGIDMVDAMDNLTNKMIAQNAEMLHTNSISTAKASQRLVIDPKVFEDAVNKMINTADEVVKECESGRIAREKGIKAMEDIQRKFASRDFSLPNSSTSSSNTARITH